MAVVLLTDDQLRAIVEDAVERGARRALDLADGGDVLSTAQAAKLARVTRKTVNDWINEGRLPAGHRGRNRTIRREDLDRFLAGDREDDGVPTATLAAGLRRPA